MCIQTQGSSEAKAEPSSTKESPKRCVANTFFVERINRSVAEAANSSGNPKEPEEYPCIDISSWMEPSETNKAARDQVVQQVAKEATESGSFNFSGHGIPIDLFDRLGAQSKKFFDMSIEEKKKFSIEGSPHGYTPIQSESTSAIYDRKTKETERKDLREVFGTVYPPEASNSQGSAPKFYQNVLEEYNHHMNRLDIILHDLLTAALAHAKGISLPQNTFNKAKGASTQGCLRCSRYSSMPKEYDDAGRLGAHSDWGPITLLYTETRGLEEIRGGSWIRVPVRRGEMHVSLGEVAAAWSNMHFKNNIHRVSQEAIPDRLSYAYFCGQGFDLSREDTDQDGIEPICGPGEAPMFGKISPSSHVAAYLKTYLMK